VPTPQRSVIRVAVGVLLVQCLSVGEANAEGPTTARARAPGTDYDEVTVLGIRSGVLDDDASAFSTRIEVDGLQGSPRSLADVLSETTGVQVRRFGGPGERAEVSIRGFSSSQVAVTLDGVRLNSARGGGVNITNIPIQLLEEVEVARGGGAVDVGSGAMGGVVALRTRRPGGEPEVRGSLSYGSFDTWDGSLYAGAPGRFVDWGVGYNGFKTDGDFVFRTPIIDNGGTPIPPLEEEVTRINNRSDRHALTGNFGREIADAGYLQLFQTLGYTSAGQPGLALIGNIPNAGQSPDAHLRQFDSLTQLRFEDVGLGIEGAELDSSIYYRFQRSRFKDPSPLLGDPIDTRFDEAMGGLSLKPRWQGRGLGMAHRVDTEIGAFRESMNATSQPYSDRYSVDVMLRDDASLLDDRLHVVPALRLDWTDDFGDEWLPSLGIVAWPVPWLRIKGNVERSYRVPSFEELYLPDQGFIQGNPNLVPEEALGGDVGLELRFDGWGPIREIHFEAAYFHNAIEDSIVWVVVSPTTIEPRNTGDATTKGYELRGSMSFWSWLEVSANHTHLDARYDETGVRLPGRADSETNLRIALGIDGIWQVLGEMQDTGSISVSEAGGLTLPPRRVWNASGGMNVVYAVESLGFDAIPDELWLNFAVFNIGDQSVRDALSFPQPGRSFKVALEGSW
jgi:outer membrane receptor protein involved in Fe transport